MGEDEACKVKGEEKKTHPACAGKPLCGVGRWDRGHSHCEEMKTLTPGRRKDRPNCNRAAAQRFPETKPPEAPRL